MVITTGMISASFICVLRGRVELLAELHDVDAVRAERRTDGRRRVRLAGGELQLDLTCDLLHDRAPTCQWCLTSRTRGSPTVLDERLVRRLAAYVFSTCMKSSVTGVARPKMLICTRTFCLSGWTSSRCR